MTKIQANVYWRDKTLPPLIEELDVASPNTYNGVTCLSCKDGLSVYIPTDQYRLITIKFIVEAPSGQPASI